MWARSCNGQWSKMTRTVLNECVNAARLLYLFGGVLKDAFMIYMYYIIIFNVALLLQPRFEWCSTWPPAGFHQWHCYECNYCPRLFIVVAWRSCKFMHSINNVYRDMIVFSVIRWNLCRVRMIKQGICWNTDALCAAFAWLRPCVHSCFASMRYRLHCPSIPVYT